MITTSLAKPQGQKYETTSILSMAILFYQFWVRIVLAQHQKYDNFKLVAGKSALF